MGRRPVAIMLNNLKQALPQLGVSDADIDDGLPCRGRHHPDAGGLSGPESGRRHRLVAFRTYYLELALGHDAVYIHAGGSPDAYEDQSLGVTALDGVNGPTAAPALAPT